MGEGEDTGRKLGQATITSDADAPAVARALLARWLDGHSDGQLHEDAFLLVSELVSNSVRHAGQPAGAPVLLSAFAIDGHVRVEVDDEGSGPVRLREPDGQEGGFGLQLVELVAARWGVNHARGTQVWFELAVRNYALE